MGRPWFHVMWSTYGTWLPGDERGFRSRGHKIHSSGTYKNPPPAGEHAGLLAYSRRVVGGEVVLSPDLRARALAAVLEKADMCGFEVECFAVAAAHVHGLIRLERETCERDVGRLKRHSSLALRDVLPGTVRGGGCDPRVIRDEEPFGSTVTYILDHARKEGAAVWHRRGLCERSRGENGPGAR